MASASNEPGKEDWTNMNKKDLEEQYSPSRWSKRYAHDEIIDAHVKEAARLSKAARADLPRPPRLDVPYGSAPRAKVDVFGEDLPGDSPIMVYVHGGYWQELSKDLSAYPVAPLYKAGILSVIVGYDLAPQGLYTRQLLCFVDIFSYFFFLVFFFLVIWLLLFFFLVFVRGGKNFGFGGKNVARLLKVNSGFQPPSASAPAPAQPKRLLHPLFSATQNPHSSASFSSCFRASPFKVCFSPFSDSFSSCYFGIDFPEPAST
ncbi:kynurenine formamidase [Penaeus vannamei]|uniref:kynurenine formamidase n=1 Tax=Penaeus vannamei TaxID=6689 RepID=UPI00387FAD8B